MKTISVLGICGSLRKKSANRALLEYAITNLPDGVEMAIADISDIPFYNPDVSAIPPSVTAFYQALAKADALMLSGPEYNYSISPALKNALDWASVSVDKTLVLQKPTALLGAGGSLGTARAQYHLRQVAVYLQLDVLHRPEIFCNAFQGTFDDQNCLIDNRIQKQISEQLVSLKAKVVLRRQIEQLGSRT